MGRKQLEIAGTERPNKVKDVDEAAEAYVEVRDKRMALTKKEAEKKSALIEVMKKHNLTAYEDLDADPQLLVTVIEGKVDVKVKALGEEEEAA